MPALFKASSSIVFIIVTCCECEGPVSTVVGTGLRKSVFFNSTVLALLCSAPLAFLPSCICYYLSGTILVPDALDIILNAMLVLLDVLMVVMEDTMGLLENTVALWRLQGLSGRPEWFF